MGVSEVVCTAFSLTVLEVKTEIMCLRAKGMPESTATLSVEAAGQVYNQTNGLVYLWAGTINHNYSTDLSIEVDRRIPNAWCSFWKYTLELYDRQSPPLKLKIRMLGAEVLDAVWLHHVKPRACHYDTLGRTFHRFLTHCIGWRKHNRADHSIFSLDTLTKTESESIEATLLKRRILFAEFVALMEDTRLPKCRCSENCWGARAVWCWARKRVDGVFPGRPQNFRHHRRPVDDCSPGRDGWCTTAEQGVEHFMAK